jgi:capsular polysaccharide transport system ATP-binding protein
LIIFDNVTKTYPLGRGRKTIVEGLSLSIPRGKSVAILGGNGTGKSTVIRMISGAELPDTGRVRRVGVKVSWPLGFGGGFNGHLSGRENLRFVARVYGQDVKAVTDVVEGFAGLGKSLDMPVKTYSSGMRARLAFGLSMAIDFEVYLIDELLSVGDASFQRRCEEFFQARRQTADVILASHNAQRVKRFCTSGCVLHRGRLRYFEDIDAAIACYRDIMRKVS